MILDVGYRCRFVCHFEIDMCLCRVCSLRSHSGVKRGLCTSFPFCQWPVSLFGRLGAAHKQYGYTGTHYQDLCTETEEKRKKSININISNSYNLLQLLEQWPLSPDPIPYLLVSTQIVIDREANPD